MSGSSATLRTAAASSNSNSTNNAADSGLDDEDTSNESTTVASGGENINASLSQNKDDLFHDDDFEEDHDHQNLDPPPAPPTSPTTIVNQSHGSHYQHHLTLGDYSLLPEEDQHNTEFQNIEADQPLLHRPFHMGRIDLDRIDNHAGDMELSESKVEDSISLNVFPGKFNNNAITNGMQASNECKALIKFEFPSSSTTQLLPNLVCEFQQSESNYYRSLHVDTANHHYKNLNMHHQYASEAPTTSLCRALIPYEQHDLHHKDRVYGCSVRRLHNNLQGPSSSSRRHRRIHDNWNNLKKEHAEHRLRVASNAGNVDLVKRILFDGGSYDISPNSADEMGRTSLHMAACKGFTDVVSVLLEAGASPNKKDTLGNTPLHLAACTNHFSVVTRLLRAGTDVSTLDNHGRNPLQLAQSKLRILAQCKSNSNDLTRIKKEVQQIIEMMREYLQKKGQDEEAELMNTFASRLTIESVDEDVKSLLANLSSLSLMDRKAQHGDSSAQASKEQLVHLKNLFK